MFRCEELIKATGGKLTGGSRERVVKGVSLDSRTIKKQEAFIAFKGENFDGHDFIGAAIKKGANCIILKEGFSVKRPEGIVFIEVADPLKALGDIACAHRLKFKIPVIAVTGSSGKTTAKEMIAHVLSRRYNVLKNEGTKNNQIGLPQALLLLKPEHELAVLEIGTNHFGEVGYLAKICHPDIGIITNIGPAHLEYFGSLSGVFREKSSLLRQINKSGIAILNADDKFLQKELNKKNRGLFRLGIGIKEKSDFFASLFKFFPDSLEFSVNGKEIIILRSPAAHNIYNALLAISVGRIFGLGYKEITAALANFSFPRGRFNSFTRNGIRFIDDTYNSNPFSLTQALQAFSQLEAGGRKILVMGDMLELGKSSLRLHQKAGQEIARVCDAFIAVGKFSKFAAIAAEKCGLAKSNIFSCATSKEAGQLLCERISPVKNDIVLVKGSRRMKMEEVFFRF